MPSDRHLMRSSVVVGSFSLLGSSTGIPVETSIAAQLGLSKSSDSFYAAFTVPYIICNLLSATGQFSLVPFFTTLETRHSDPAVWRVQHSSGLSRGLFPPGCGSGSADSGFVASALFPGPGGER